jgi:hypothetical protein
VADLPVIARSVDIRLDCVERPVISIINGSVDHYRVTTNIAPAPLPPHFPGSSIQYIDVVTETEKQRVTSSGLG